MLPTLRVQVILFGRTATDVFRLAGAVAASARYAQGSLGSVGLAFGDCSPQPVLGPEQRDALVRRAQDSGLAACSYKHFGANLGHGGGHNRLAEQSADELLLILNPDTFLSPATMARLVQALVDETVGMAEARQLPVELPKAFAPDTGDTGWASGACVLVRRRAFVKAGKFDDEHFFLYCDDVDLSWRVRLAGWRIVYVPDAVVFHDLRLSCGLAARRSAALGTLMLVHKYFGPGDAASRAAMMARDGTDAERAGAADYQDRARAGRGPSTVVNGAAVAHIDPTNCFAPVRF